MEEIKPKPITTIVDLFRECRPVYSAEVRVGDYLLSDGSFKPKIDQVVTILPNVFTDERGIFSDSGKMAYVYRRCSEPYKPLKFIEDSSLHVPGAKDDNGKPEMSLVLFGFADALIEVGKVATYGKKKYTENGWKSVPDGIKRYADAGIRHQLAEAKEPLDVESGLLHAAHQAWNSLARLQLLLETK